MKRYQRMGLATMIFGNGWISFPEVTDAAMVISAILTGVGFVLFVMIGKD